MGRGRERVLERWGRDYTGLECCMRTISYAIYEDIGRKIGTWELKQSVEVLGKEPEACFGNYHPAGNLPQAPKS